MGITNDNGDTTVYVSNIPYCTSNNSVAVGFQSDRDVFYLRKMLLDIMSKSRKELKNELTNAIESQTVSLNRNNDRNNDRNSAAERENNNKLYKQNERIAKSLEKDKEKGMSKAAKAYIAAAIEHTLKAYNIALGPAMRLSNLFMDIESSGIFLKNGFDDLHEAANRVGMSHEQMAAMLKRTAPMLAKFNAAGKNGIQTVTKSMAAIDNSLNLSNEEREAAVDATMNYIPSVRLASMSQEELNVAVNQTAKQLKMLAMATGKTVEQIKEEQDIKAKTLRVKAYARSHPNQYKAMTAAGMNDDMIDYVASGGLRVTPEIMMSMAGPQNQFWRGLIQEFIKGNGKDSFNIETLGQYLKNNQSTLDQSLRFGERTASNQGLYAVQAASTLHENFAQGAGNYFDMEKLLALGGLNGVLDNTSAGYKKSQNALQRIYEAARNREHLDNNMEWLKSGGIEGVSEIAGLQASIYGLLSHMSDYLEKFFGDSGLLTVITMALAPFFARYIGDKVLKGILNGGANTASAIGRIREIIAAGRGGLLARSMASSVASGLTSVGFLAAGALATQTVLPLIGGMVEQIKKKVTGEEDEEKEKYGEDIYLGNEAAAWMDDVLNGGFWNAIRKTTSLIGNDTIRLVTGEKTVIGQMRNNEVVRSYLDESMAKYGIQELEKQIEENKEKLKDAMFRSTNSEISEVARNQAAETAKILEKAINDMTKELSQYRTEYLDIERKKEEKTIKAQYELEKQREYEKLHRNREQIPSLNNS